MTTKQALALGASILALVAISASRLARAQSSANPIVRIAELEIDPAHLDAYKAALRQEIETSIRVEPGVLNLYAVAIKDHPTQIRLFETYRDLAAYHSHLQTPHFKRYKADTASMVKELTLIETEPILLGPKP